MTTRPLICTSAALLGAMALPSIASAQISITHAIFADACGEASSPAFQLTGALGQSVAGRATSPTFTINAGFWTPGPLVTCRADFNGDGNVDPDDLADYITGFFSVPPSPGADFNGDGNVDPDDLADYITGFFAGC